MSLTQKILDGITGKGKLRSKIERDTRGWKYLALTSLASLGVMIGGDYWMQKQAERRAELEASGLRPSESEHIYQAPDSQESSRSYPVAPIQNSLERAALENSAAKPDSLERKALTSEVPAKAEISTNEYDNSPELNTPYENLKLPKLPEINELDDLPKASTNKVYAPEKTERGINCTPEQKSEVKTNSVQENKTEYAHPITPEFISAVIHAESKGKATATSPKGARGLMQVMPETWAEQTRKLYGEPLPFSEAYDPEKNKEIGTNYLIELHNYLSNKLPDYKTLKLDEQQKKIAAAYNGGPNRLKRKAGDISRMPKETRRYVDEIYTRLYAKSN